MIALGLACAGALVYFFNIWSSGFSMSEGHRVAPGWEMVSSGDWLLPHMFEQAYLRKPPGMPWAVAALSYVFGQSEWAARSVSGLAMIGGSIASAWYTRRWFGNSASLTAGVAAGLAHLLLPWMWESGRAAEIEALNNLGTALAVWGLVDLLVGAGKRTKSIGIAAVGIVIAALAKGPASLPVIVAVPVAACLLARSVMPLKSREFWVGLIAGAAATGAIAGLIVYRYSHEQGFVVTQSVEEFLWSRERVLRVIALPFVFLASALPVSIAFIPVLTARELGVDRSRIARTLALAAALAVFAYTMAGISNPRYTLPAAAVLSPLMGFAVLTWKAQAQTEGGISRLARLCYRLTRPAAVVLTMCAVGYAIVSETRREASSGREAGWALGRYVETDSIIFANDMVEARPEIFLYAMGAAEEEKKSVRTRWLPDLKAASLAEVSGAKNAYVLVRTDAGSKELAELKQFGILDRLQITLFHCELGPPNRRFSATLYRMRR